MGCGQNDSQDRRLQRSLLRLQSHDCPRSTILSFTIRLLRARTSICHAVDWNERSELAHGDRNCTFSWWCCRCSHMSVGCCKDEDADTDISGRPRKEQPSVAHGKTVQEEGRSHADTTTALVSTDCPRNCSNTRHVLCDPWSSTDLQNGRIRRLVSRRRTSICLDWSTDNDYAGAVSISPKIL